MTTEELAWTEDLHAARRGEPAALDRVLKRSRQDLRQLECFASWLFRIVKRECNRYKRLKRMLMQVPITEDIEGPHYPESKGLARDVAKALESLPGHYREIILLRDLEGLTIEEISEQLGTTRLAAKARLHRARSLAREYLLA